MIGQSAGQCVCVFANGGCLEHRVGKAPERERESKFQNLLLKNKKNKVYLNFTLHEQQKLLNSAVSLVCSG